MPSIGMTAFKSKTHTYAFDGNSTPYNGGALPSDHSDYIKPTYGIDCVLVPIVRVLREIGAGSVVLESDKGVMTMSVFDAKHKPVYVQKVHGASDLDGWFLPGVMVASRTAIDIIKTRKAVA